MMLCLDAFFTVKDKIILLFNKFYKGPKTKHINYLSLCNF